MCSSTRIWSRNAQGGPLEALTVRKQKMLRFPWMYLLVPIRLFWSAIADFDQPRNRQWSLSLHGYRGEVGRSAPAAPPSKLWETSTIVVWPPRELEKSGNRLHSRFSPAVRKPAVQDCQPTCWRRRLRSFPRRRMLLGLYRTEGSKIRYIELGEKTTGKFRPMGLMKVNRAPVPGTRGPAHREVVIDFGTSNSAVLWKLTDHEPRFLR